MALAPFFDRIYGAVGMHLSVSKEALSASLTSTTVGIVCGPDLTSNDLHIAEMVVNLAARHDCQANYAICEAGHHCAGALAY